MGRSLKTCVLLALSLLTPRCAAGPLFLAFPALMPLFGLGISGIWFTDVVIVNGLVFAASSITAGSFVLGSVGGPIAAGIEVSKSKSAAAAAAAASSSSASLESVLSVSSSLAEKSWSENVAALQSSSVAAVASVQAEAAKPLATDTTATLFSFTKHKVSGTSVLPLAKRSVPSAYSSAYSSAMTDLAQMTEADISALSGPTPTQDPMLTYSSMGGRKRDLPPPPGTPISTFSGPMPSLPPGVPEYNLRLCQNDIIAMGIAKQSLVIGQPDAQSLRVDNVPATCMVLATLVMGDPTLGPHPIPMGSASLQWNSVSPENISTARQFFGYSP